MLRFHPSRFIWVLALMLGMWMVGSQAQEYRYHYVSLNKLKLPTGFNSFGAVKITNNGRVYGTLGSSCSQPPCPTAVAVYEKGTVTALQAGEASTANEAGAIGGGVLVGFDPDDWYLPYRYQAALFEGKKVKLIPPRTGEISSTVIRLSDSGIALVKSFGPPTCEDCPPREYYFVFYPNNGQIIPLEQYVEYVMSPVSINNQGLVAATTVVGWSENPPMQILRAFLFNPLKGEMTLLNPLSPDMSSYGQEINNRGDVVGYSLTGPQKPGRIGVWSKQGEFETYLDEGTVGPKFYSNYLLFNDNNLIAISAIFPDNQIEGVTAYLVPKPGVLLNLADLLVDNQEFFRSLQNVLIYSMNNHGDIIGAGAGGPPTYTYDQFLLIRVGPGKPLK